MKIYKTQKEVEKDIKNGILNCNYEDVKFECDIDIDASIINAWNINAEDIKAWNINARNINAENISYYAFCCSYNSIKCKSWEAKRDNAHDPICLDGELIIKNEEETVKVEISKKSLEVLKNAGIKIINK